MRRCALSARHGPKHYALFRLSGMKNTSLKNSSMFIVELCELNRKQPCRALASFPVRYLPIAYAKMICDLLDRHAPALQLVNQPAPVFLFFAHALTNLTASSGLLIIATNAFCSAIQSCSSWVSVR